MGLGSLEGGDEGDSVAVRFAAPTNMGRARYDVGVPGGFAVVHVDVVDDDVGDILEGYASTAGDVDVDAAAVDGLEAVDNELVFELNGHVGREDDPEGFVLDDSVVERARSWVRWVGIGGVGDYVDQAPFAPQGVHAEPNAAIGEPLVVVAPVLAAPAVVNWVTAKALASCGV
ncbi:hypothetical protein ACFX2J_040774 [Malus domestica]